MRVLVTGHLGYIGSVLVPMLLQEGFGVSGIDSDLFHSCSFSEDQKSVASLKIDIRDVKLSDLKGFDAIIHLAALSNDPLGDLDPDLTFEINHKATIKLAELSKKAGIKRFLFSSSCSNYGEAGENLLTEESEFNPITPYGHSKVMAELDLRKIADKNFSPVFLRNATAYGTSPKLRFDLVLNNLVAWAQTTGKVYLKSDGNAWRPIIHVEDIARAFITLLKAPKELIHNQAFNVGITKENYKISTLADIVTKNIPKSKVEYSKSSFKDPRCYKVNCDKISKTLGSFKPQWNAKKGAKQLYESYKKSKINLEDFEGVRYKRIDHIKSLISSGKLDAKLRWK